MPQRSRKKLKVAVNTKPKWVGDVEVENPDPGRVYNIYECRECIIPHDEDKVRPKWKRKVHVPWQKKKRLEAVCPEHGSLMLVKYKKCTCGQEYWGSYLKSNPTCKECGKFSDIPIIDLSYYRMGDFYRKTDEDLSDIDRWDCIHRNLCLECTFVDGSKKAIACKECPYYSSEGL